DLRGGATDSAFGTLTVTNRNIVTIAAGQVLELQGGAFTQTATGMLLLDHDATPSIGHVTTSATATLAGCIGGTGPAIPPNTGLTATTAGTVTGTFSCTVFAGQQLDVGYAPGLVLILASSSSSSTTTTSSTTTSSTSSTTTSTTTTTTSTTSTTST